MCKINGTPCCGACVEELSDKGLTDEQIVEKIGGQCDERYSCGAYAGRYCDKHWREAGYIDGPAVVGGATENEVEAWDYRDE